MLEYFVKQEINSDVVAINSMAMQTMESLIADVVTSNELAAKVQALDKQIEQLNSLENYIADCRKLYGADHRKEEFDWQLQNKDAAISHLTAERTEFAKAAVALPQILSIKALVRLSDIEAKESIKAVTKEATQPIKSLIEAGSLNYLNRIIEKEYASLTLVEVAHVLNQFVSGKIKIFGKLTVSELSAAFIAYAQEKAAYLELQAEEAHISQKDTRSYGELSVAMAKTRQRLFEAEQTKKDVADAKRYAQKERYKQSYLSEPKQEVVQAYTFDKETGVPQKIVNGKVIEDDFKAS